jgi:23S rRNA pseudouridine1911/1915/1917 synthase
MMSVMVIMILKDYVYKYKQFIDNCLKALLVASLRKNLRFILAVEMRFDTELPQDFQDCIEMAEDI